MGLNSSQPRAEWNYPAVLACLFGAMVVQSILGPSLCYLGTVNMILSAAVDAIVILRVSLARIRREQGRGWICYAILPYLVIPLFLVMEHVWMSGK